MGAVLGVFSLASWVGSGSGVSVRRVVWGRAIGSPNLRRDRALAGSLGGRALGCREYPRRGPKSVMSPPPPPIGIGRLAFRVWGERRRPGRHCLQFRLPRPREASGLWVPLELEPGPRNESSAAWALCFVSKYPHKVASFNFGRLK